MAGLPPAINRRIGRALHAYDMLADGDRVLVAVSGGVDSLVLTWVLSFWRRKAPIDYDLFAVHLDNGFDASGGEPVAEQLRRTGVPFLVEQTEFGARALAAEDGKSVCYHCARQRRNRLFEIARQQGFSKIAFGHHRDDIVETFFLNLLYGGNLSTMVPRQTFFDGALQVIRPLAFLDKSDILQLAAAHNIQPVKNPCPQDCHSKRQEVRGLVENLYRLDPRVKGNVFAALANVRDGYLL